MITVFYDGKCGLCSREINHYRKVAPLGIFDWQDITESSVELEKVDLSVADALKELHATDHEGSLYKGIDAFILIWNHMHRWHILAAMVSLPIIYRVASFVYQRFAKWRFNRLDYCQLSLQEEK